MGNSAVCNNCKNRNHSNCSDKANCPCKCNSNNSTDIKQKVLATFGGAAMAVGGVALTVSTGGIGGVLLGGALLGSGVSSAYQGVEKTIKNERLSAKSYVTDIVFGATTGLLSGGVGAVGEAIASNVAKTVIVRSGAGAVAGVGSKVVNEIKEIATTDKKLSDFGKTLDENGKPLDTGATVASWVISAAVGAAGGIVGSADLSKIATSELGKSVTRVSLSAATAASCDSIAQGASIASGAQKKFNTERLLGSMVTAASTTAAFEGVKQVNYALNGGKEEYLQKKSNEKMIKDDNKIPIDKKQQVINNGNNLKDIPTNSIENDIKKFDAYEHARQTHFDEIEVNRMAKEGMQDYKNNLVDHLKSANNNQQKFDLVDMINDAKSSVQYYDLNSKKQFGEVKPTHLYKDYNNAHVLNGEHSLQIAFDLPDCTNEGTRGTNRAIFDIAGHYDDRKLMYQYVGYIDDHDYRQIPRYGDRSFEHQLNKDNIEHRGYNHIIREIEIDDDDQSLRKRKKKIKK